MTAQLPGPTLAEFITASSTVAHVAQSTPIEVSRYLGEILGVTVTMKCENLQRTGAYKVRGAYNRMSKLTDAERALGVVAASAGNHAQGVALAAHELGIHATVFMPIGVALPKLQATKAYGADVVLRGVIFNEALDAAKDFTEKSGAIFIPPFDNHDVIAGQGTVGLEIWDQVPDVETVIIPVGGGGLIAGVASAMKQRAAEAGRTLRVIGVQSAQAAAYPPSLEAGSPTAIQVKPTIADGISVAKPGKLPFAIIQETVDEIVTVSDDDIARALLMLLERAKLVVEPAGAAGVAAIIAGKITASGPTTVILSGGNIDPKLMEQIISRGLIASGRYLHVRVPLPDRPGQLAKVAEILASQNANVIEVLHTRHGTGLNINQVELSLDIETRGPDHSEQVLDSLRSEGFEPYVDA
ncbi:MAG: threonine ammonia-lyase [Microbacteriaceae bacterium]|jgi:threonine dehydratase